MNTNPLPKPNGTPARMGEIQCMDGFAVHENQNSPIGINTLPMQTAITAASGAGRPVVGSRGCMEIIRRISGSRQTAIAVPVPMPQ